MQISMIMLIRQLNNDQPISELWVVKMLWLKLPNRGFQYYEYIYEHFI